jgi:hypothetical protein
MLRARRKTKRKMLPSEEATMDKGRSSHVKNGNKKLRADEADSETDVIDEDDDDPQVEELNSPIMSRLNSNMIFSTHLKVFDYNIDQIYELLLSHGVPLNICEFFSSNYFV